MIANLKGKLKLAPNLEKKKKEEDKKAKDKDSERSTRGRDNKKKKNKKDTSNKKNQKKEEVWKRVPPIEGEVKEKIVKEKTFHWCEHPWLGASALPRTVASDSKGRMPKESLSQCRPQLPLQPLQVPPLLPSSLSCWTTNDCSEWHVHWECLQCL
jgi:hypothetical protein